MSDSPDPRDDAGQCIVPADPAATALDAHGHDPSRYQWVPVLRKPRADGWTPQRQRDFIAALADCGCVAEAAREAGMSERSCYRLRRESPHFAAAWGAAIAHAAPRLVDLAFDRVIHGSDEPVFDKDGRRVGRRMRTNDRLMMFLLRAYMPDRFGQSHHGARRAADPAPDDAPIADAMRLLEPAQPAEPRLLMPPDELVDALLCADMLDGRLPHWHVGEGDGDAEPVAHMSLGPAFERALEATKREAAGLPPLPEGGEDADDDDDAWG